MDIEIKICDQCNIPKFITEFGLNGKSIRKKCKICISECMKEYRSKNSETIKLKRKNWREINKIDISLSKKKWGEENKNSELYKEKAKLKYEKNKESIKKRNSEYRKKRMQEDPLFRLKYRLSTLIRNAFKRQFTIKSSKTLSILGCSFEEFKIHIEKQFDDKMNWDNHGTYWHLDHIKPISLATTVEEMNELNHYTNFQPLEAKENLSKGNKYNL